MGPVLGDVSMFVSACAKLKANKAVDRKNAACQLLELLSDDDHGCPALDSNSAHRDTKGATDRMTWNVLFMEVRDYFAKETEKLSISQMGSAAKSFSFSVVDKVFQKGISHRPWIHWNKILDFIMSYLSKDVHAKIYGSALVSMLQNFLNIEYYVSVIDSNCWVDLIRLLIKLYGKFNIPQYMILQSINVCIQEGSNHPNVIPTLRADVVQFYLELFSLDNIGARTHISIILRGITALCRKNAVEFRGILCKLGELLIPKVLHSSANYNMEEEGAIIEFLLVQVQIHSPCDVDTKNAAFYAHDIKIWTDILKSIYGFCIDTFEDIAIKKQSHFNKDLQVSDKLFLLAAKCTKQVFEGISNGYSSSGDDEDEPNPSKKSMRFRPFQNILTDVCNNMSPGERQIVWMNYLTAILTQFPKLVDNRTNFSSLMGMGHNLLHSSYVTRREVYTYFLCILNTEKYLIGEGILKTRSKSWESVWDVTLRSLSVSEFKIEAMELLRRLLIEFQPSNVHSLLTLYTGGAIPMNQPSLCLLAEYLSRCSLPLFLGCSSTNSLTNALVTDDEIGSTVCPRSALIRWLIASSGNTGNSEEQAIDFCLGHEPMISTILCSLLVRQTHNLIYAEKFCHRNHGRDQKIFSELSQFEAESEDFEKLILQCCFVSVPSEQEFKEENEVSGEESREALKLSLISNVPGRLAEALIEDYDKLPPLSHTLPDFMKKFSQLNYRVALYMNIINILEKHSIGGGNGEELGFRTNLERLFDKSLARCIEATIDFITKGKNKSAMQVQELISIFRNILRSNHLTDGLKSILAQRFPQQMQELLKKVYRCNLVRYMEKASNNPSETLMFKSRDVLTRFISTGDEEEGGISECRQIELAALESLGCLIDYGILCDHRTDLFTDILTDCFHDVFSSTIPFIFEFSSELITRLLHPLSSSQNEEYTNVLTLVTNLLQKMCRGFYQIPQCSARLWDLFTDITELTAKDSDINKKNLMILVGTLSGFMRSRNPYGSSILVCQAGFRNLKCIAQNDPKLEWSVFIPKNGPNCWVLNETYEFLANPSNQIRLFAVDAIQAMYQSAAPPGSLSAEYLGEAQSRPLSLEQYFNQIRDYLQRTFQVSATLTQDENSEEAVNRTSIALSTLTRLVFAYPFLQKKSLFAFLQLVKIKGIDIALAHRALLYASPKAPNTMCCHISYLLHMWVSSGYSIEDFPYQFFGCEEIGDFYTRFKKEISVEFFQRNDTAGLEKFSKFLNTEPIQLVKDCYGMLMARVVPGIAVYKATNHCSNRDIGELQDTQQRLIKLLGGQAVSLMMTKLEDVVMESVLLVFDPEIPSKWGCSRVSLPEPSSPYYDEASVNRGLDFVKEASSRKDFSLVAFLATYTPRAVYDTLLTLITRVHNGHDALEKLWRLHQFSYFVNLLFQETPSIFNTMKEYVCQFVIYAYIRLLNAETGNDQSSKDMRTSLLFLISQLVIALTLTFKDEMKQHYYLVVNTLVTTVIKYPELLDVAKKSLDVLITRYTEDFADCIMSLDPFPTTKIKEFEVYKSTFQAVKYGPITRGGELIELQWPLHKELKSCLEDAVKNGNWTTERLKWIRELLSMKKRDLEKLVKNLEGKRFSDECHNDFIHVLVQILINVIKRGVEEDAVLEAARCLGEIGPLDLSVLVLPSKFPGKEIKGTVRSVQSMIEILSEYLKSDDINLVKTTGDVLKKICHMEDCIDIIGKQMAKTRTEAILKPFKFLPAQELAGPKTLEQISANLIETKLGLNEMNEFVDYKSWVMQLTCGLIECFKDDYSVIAKLLPICQIKMEFCQDILPFIFYSMLQSGKTNPLVRRTVSGYFRNFFNKCIYNLSNVIESSRSFTPVTSTCAQTSIYTNKLALRILLGVVQFLRIHQAPQEQRGTVKLTPWDNNFWLHEVSYFDLAKAAQYCGAYLTSILFTEIAVTELEMNGNSQSTENASGEIESFYSQGAVLLPRIRSDCYEKLLLKAYTSIGEPDAVYGCGSARFSEGKLNISHLQQRMQFFRVLSASDGNAIDSESSSETGVCGALKDLGLYNSLWTYLHGVEARDNILDHELSEIQHECGWRLSKWDLHSDKSTYLKDESILESSKSHLMFQRFLYESVQTGLAKDIVNHVQNVKRGYKSVARNLRHASVESSENLYGFLCQFQMVRVVEDFFNLELEQGVEKFLSKWKGQDRINSADFKFQEPVLSLRNVLLHSYGQKNTNVNFEPAYDESMLELLAKARDCGRLEIAENCASCISSSVERSLRKDLEIAKNHWVRGDQDIARHILGKLIKKSNPDGCELYPNLLLIYGEWLSESMSERPTVILEKYLSRSCTIFEKRGQAGLTEGAKAQFVLAKYADEQFKNVVKYMKSEIYAEKIEHLKKARQDVAAVSSNADTDIRRSAIALRKQSNIDEEEITAIAAERKKFLQLALQHYLRGLKDSNEQDLLIFRVVALWLENAEVAETLFVNDIIKNSRLPSYKFVIVLHQLSARLSTSSTSASSAMIDNLNMILMTCAEQHPYHTLPVLLTQALLHEDKATGKPTAKKQNKQHFEERVEAALGLVTSLKRNKSLAQLTNKMEALWKALISLANVHEKANTSSSSVLIPNDSDIRKLKGIEICPVPTATLPVSITAEYSESIVGIKLFDATYGLVGGINSPKRISCTGTNGLRFNMLLKGQDDLRQDAVMQQVFSVMNKLLQNEPKTKMRRLHVRTYKVVPLSQRTGILEWCENTQTFGDYLTGDNGAHQKYRPTDFAPMECRRKLLAVKDAGDNEKKYSAFMTILEHFKPVFRHFFFENFKEAGTFFERRLAYTRSVATNSMVGYILGLGDRHVLNILVDKTTAEFVHIDLGVAFEQGRILPTPETIPFRLTRDVVDGMGVAGVEGVFRKSCEMTMEVLRNNTEIILTILEVLLYDPLYMWTLTADRVKKVQPSENSRAGVSNRRASVASSVAEEAPKERNSSAARVLLRLRQKLAGIEEGGTSASALSVPGHVSLLIQRAMDPERLSRLFPGWQPYL